MGKQQVVTPPERDPYVMRALEPRIVLDAAAVETVMDVSHETLDISDSSQPDPNQVETTNPYHILEEKLANPDIDDEQPLRNEVIFIAAESAVASSCEARGSGSRQAEICCSILPIFLSSNASITA